MVNNKTSLLHNNQSQKREWEGKESPVFYKVVPVQFQLRDLTCDFPRYKGILT